MSKERPICPNCKSSRIRHKWIEKCHVPPTPKDITFDEHAETLKKNHPGGLFFISGDNESILLADEPEAYFKMKTISDYVQLVVFCEECGYTKVFDIEHKNKQSV